MWRWFVVSIVCAALSIGPIQAEGMVTRPPLPAPSEAPPSNSKPDHKTLAVAAIVVVLIAASVAGYVGNCSCPQNTDKAGHSCGKRAAYHRPGGWKPLCFPTDVTPQMIEAYRKTGNPATALALLVQP